MLQASVRIYHIPSNIDLYTVKETTDSHGEAFEQFLKLSETISKMPADHTTMVLETSNGPKMLSRKFLTDSILSLQVTNDGN